MWFQVENLRLELDSHQGVEAELRGQCADLEALLQSHLDRTQAHSSSFSTASEEIVQLSEDLANTRNELVNSVIQIFSIQSFY